MPAKKAATKAAAKHADPKSGRFSAELKEVVIEEVEHPLTGQTTTGKKMTIHSTMRPWAVELDAGVPSIGLLPLRVVAVDKEVLIGSDRTVRECAERDQDNVLEAWPEHGLLGTQLGPNKNGRKW